MQRVLIIEDEPELAKELLLAFASDAAQLDIDWVQDGESGLTRALDWKPELILLDLHLPGISGINILRQVQQNLKETKVCIISSSGSLEERLHGFREGSDDYIVKPFAAKEVLARSMALLKRGRLSVTEKICLGTITLDLSKKSVLVSDRVLRLTHKEASVLAYLMRRPDQVITRAELLDTVWEGHDRYFNTVDAYVERLRKKIDRPFQTRYLQTVYGEGYFFASQ